MTTTSDQPTIKLIDWQELNFPETIYKYRTWSDKYHKTILTGLQVFLSPPKGFEDSLDCKNPIRYDLLTDEEIHWRYFNSSQTTNLHFNKDQHKQFSDRCFATSNIRDKEFIKQSLERDFFEYNDRIGILSLTEDPTNIKMWEKYSALHSGFCVGFNSNIMFKYLGGGGKVKYCNELPIIKPYPWEDRTSQTVKQVYYKLDKFEFEKEYRTQHFSYTPLTNHERTVTLPQKSYKEIIFGAAMKQVDKEEIISTCKDKLFNVTFKQVVMRNSNDSVSIEQYDNR